MSAPKRKRTRAIRRSGVNRRLFLKGLGLGGATLGSGLGLSACSGSGNSDASSTANAGTSAPVGANQSNGVQPVRFLHGVASGDPTASAVIFWTRVTVANTEQRVAVRLDVFEDEALQTFVKSEEFVTDASRDFTVKIDCGGLQADRFYFYRFLSNGVSSEVGRTKTAPADTSTRALNFGLVSCSSLGHGYFNAYGQLAKRNDLDAIVHLGDYIYEYGNGEYGGIRPYQPSHEILTLSDYRTRHAQYKQDADLRQLHLRYPFITIWDDHESADNSYHDGAANHTEGVEGKWVDRKAYSQQAYDEWMPIRLPEPGNRNRIFRTLKFGQTAEWILLDTRLYDRDVQAATPVNPLDPSTANADRHMIGDEQRAFLINNMRQSTSQWKLIGNQVVFHQWIIKPGLNNPAPNPVQTLVAPSGLNGDAWDGYSAERQKIINAIRGENGQAPVNNVVFLTGDVHSAWVADITDNPELPISQAGGYNPLTGQGSVATEFVVTSVTSPGLPLPDQVIQAIRLSSPHIKHVKMSERGYSVLRVGADKTTCEYWAVSTILERGGTEYLSASFDVLKNANHIDQGLPGLI